MIIKKAKDILTTILYGTVLLIVASCTGNEDTTPINPAQPKIVTLRANHPGNTRAGFTAEGVGYWQSTDVIGIMNNGQLKPFTIDSGAGEVTASFTGEIDGELTNNAVALYPHNNKHTLDGKTLYYFFPDTYNYNGADTDYSVTTGKSFNMPMFGNVTEENEVTFINFGSVIAIKVNHLPATKGSIIVTSDATICGNASITDDFYSEKEWKYTDDNGGKTVTFNYENCEKYQTAVFYLPLLPGTYNLTITLQNENTCYTPISKSVTIKQGHIKPLKIEKLIIDIDGHKMVDLGLPSGVLWADNNVGADTPADFGNYYSWGETNTKRYYADSSNKWYITGTDAGSDEMYKKYNNTDNKNTLEAEDDAATANWGSRFRMPTYSELKELKDNCTWTWTQSTNGKGNESSGYKVTSNINGNYIFLPAAGYYYAYDKNSENSQGLYWTSNKVDFSAYVLYFLSYNIMNMMENRSYGASVRAVANP